MGLFGKKTTEVEKTELEKYRDNLDRVARGNAVAKLSEVSRYLDGVIRMSIDNPFNNEEMLINVVNKFFQTQAEKSTEIEEYVQMVKNVFDQIYYTVDSSKQFSFSLFLKIFDLDGIYDRNLFDINFYRLFSDSKQYFSVMETMMSNSFIMENFNEVIDFFSNIRSYYETSDKYYFELLYMCRRLVHGVNLSEFIRSYKERLDKKEGIYNVDEYTLDKIHEKTVGAQGFLTSLDDAIKDASRMLEVLNGRIEEYARDLDDVNRSKLTKYNSEIKDKIDAINKKFSDSKDELNKFILSLQDTARNEITGQFKNVLQELEREKVRIIDSLKEYETILTNLALQKSGDIAKLGGEQLNALDDFIKNQPHLQEIFESASSKKMLEMMREFITLQKETGNVQLVQAPQVGGVQSNIVTPNSLVMGAPGLIIPNREVDASVSKLLDFSIPFDKRFKMLEERITLNKSKGIMYHDQVLEIASYLMEGYSPYLYGPSGSGKTMLALQLLDLLDIDRIKMNYINEEYEVKGADPFLGQWSPSLVYNAYKYGAGLLVDEMDNGRAQATMALGSFISTTDRDYTFANGETVLRHPNFRLIATGNTKCDGPTANHPTREKMDEAIIQRFKPLVEIGYDEKLESEMLSKYKFWYNFIKQFRKAGEVLEHDEEEITIKGAVTTRDVAEIAKTLDTGFATTEMIINADFIRAHNREYLDKLTKELSKYYSNHGKDKDKEIYEVFNEQVLKRQRVRG